MNTNSREKLHFYRAKIYVVAFLFITPLIHTKIEAREESQFHLSRIFPGIGILHPFSINDYTNSIQLNIFFGRAKNDLFLGQYGLLFNVAEKDVFLGQIGMYNILEHGNLYGVQLGAFNVTEDKEKFVYGVQGSLINFSEGFVGLQIGFIGPNFARIVRGFQFSPLWNAVKTEMRGVQMAGFINWNDADVSGFQFSTIMNANDNMNGFQVAGLINGSKMMDGVQLSALANFATDLGGYQISAINFTDNRLKGIQIGAVNYAGITLGIQFGALNISKKNELLQVGLINYTSETARLQIGLLNIAWENPIPIFPGINFDF